jgi:hypothetical protein
MIDQTRNYAKETRYEDTPAQVRRREARNRARRKAEHSGKVHKGDKLELDHVGYHRHGSLEHVPVKVVSQHANRIRQPPRH